jgi:hypothetical protein
MHAHSTCLLLALLMCVSGAVGAAPIVYNIVNANDGVESVTGTITTKGTLGVLTGSDISAWALEARGLLNFTVNSSDNTILSFCCGLTATPELLVFDFDSDALLVFGMPAGPETREISYGREGIALLCHSNLCGSPVTYTITKPPAPQVIATVPEPAIWLLLAAGFVGLRSVLRTRPAAT